METDTEKSLWLLLLLVIAAFVLYWGTKAVLELLFSGVAVAAVCALALWLFSRNRRKAGG